MKLRGINVHDPAGPVRRCYACGRPVRSHVIIDGRIFGPGCAEAERRIRRRRAAAQPIHDEVRLAEAPKGD